MKTVQPSRANLSRSRPRRDAGMQIAMQRRLETKATGTML
jgi:hypothetical protein